MNYPTQLKLNPEIKEALIQHLDTELVNHLSERGNWIQEINDYQRDYIAKPSDEQTTFPFIGASRFIVPLTAIAFEATEARTFQKLEAMPQKIAANVKDPAAAAIKDELEIFFDDEFILQGEMLELIKPAIQEQILLGTGVAQATWQKIVKKGMRNGKPFEVIVKEGNVFESIPVTNFLMPFDQVDQQTARWCGQVFFMNPLQVQEAEQEGMFESGTTEKLRGYYFPPTVATTQVRETLWNEERLDNRIPGWPQQLNFFYIYLQFPVEKLTKGMKEYALSRNVPIDDKQEFQEICAIYHKDSRSLVGCFYNPLEDLRRPQRSCNFFSKPYRWTGIGLAEMNRSFQEEVSTQHRQIIDSGTIANTRMWKVRKGNNSIRDNEPIFPNKIWWVDDMDDVQPMKNEEIYASAFNMENQAMIYSQQRTGINEITLGMPGVGTPGTATDSSLRVQESQRKGDYTHRATLRFLSQLASDGVLNIVQYGPNIERLKYSPQGSEIEMFLKRPYEDFRKKLILDVHMVDQNDNQMLDRQTMTQLSGAAQQYYNSLIPILQALPQTQDPVLHEGYRQAIKGANQVFSQILGTFNVRDPKEYLIAVPPPLPSPQPMSMNGDPTLTDPNQRALSAGNVGTPYTPPDNSVTNINIGSGDVSGQVPSGLAGLLGGAAY
jgi:hypothetical protein